MIEHWQSHDHQMFKMVEEPLVNRTPHHARSCQESRHAPTAIPLPSRLLLQVNDAVLQLAMALVVALEAAQTLMRSLREKISSHPQHPVLIRLRHVFLLNQLQLPSVKEIRLRAKEHMTFARALSEEQ